MSRRVWAAVAAALVAVGVAVAWLLSGSSSIGAPAGPDQRPGSSDCAMYELYDPHVSCADFIKQQKQNAHQCSLPVAERKGPWIC